MKMDCSFLRLNRLRVGRGRRVVYDEEFHEGVNIIRGQNGSGKSTIADFIFFVLGGEFADWKEEAGRCTEVQAEVETPRGKLTLMRRIAGPQEPIAVYFGPIAAAARTTMEGWEQFPLRRQGGRESFSQVMFRSLLVPEAQSEGASNVTMHQVLRLCYSDQRSPASRLFRFESFDSQSIREAVGDLVCGISGYEIYEIGLRLRDLQKESEVIRIELNGLIRALPRDEVFSSTMLVQAEVEKLRDEVATLHREIENVDELVEVGEVREYLAERRKGLLSISRQRKKLNELESKVANLEFEVREIADYLEYLQEAMEKLTFAEATLAAIGSIEFTHCPACGMVLDGEGRDQHCVVCKSPLDMEREKGRYNQIRLDMEIQARESRQLVDQKEGQLLVAGQEARQLRRSHEQELSNFELKYGGGNGPREAFLAARTNRIGHIEAEVSFLLRNLEIAERIEALTKRKGELATEVENLSVRREALQREAGQRRSVALSEISSICANILRGDLERQAEFTVANVVKVDFGNDSIAVDGSVNFAESSNVVLKNTAILGMLLAAGRDEEFFHPRFVLMDNIEDKGMEVNRSHMFQRMIVEYVTEVQKPYQVIFTTSMMNPDLEVEEYVIGPAYTDGRGTLLLD